MKEIELQMSRFIDNELNPTERNEMFDKVLNDHEASDAYKQLKIINEQIALHFTDINLPQITINTKVKNDNYVMVPHLTKVIAYFREIPNTKAALAITFCFAFIVTILLSFSITKKNNNDVVIFNTNETKTQVEFVFGSEFEIQMKEIELQLQHINSN